MPNEIDFTEGTLLRAIDGETCETCGFPMSSADYGYYCSNEDCPNFDIDIMCYEE